MGYKILSKKELCPNQYEITIDAPYVVRNARAGQFIIFRAEENGERVPLTIADVNKETGALTLVFMAVGYSTKKLEEYQRIKKQFNSAENKKNKRAAKARASVHKLFRHQFLGNSLNKNFKPVLDKKTVKNNQEKLQIHSNKVNMKKDMRRNPA